MKSHINQKFFITIIILIFSLSLFFVSLIDVEGATHNITNSTQYGIKETINGDKDYYVTIILEEGEYSGENNTKINITKNVIIKGKGKSKTILNGDKNQLFHVEKSGYLTLINITLFNGESEQGGAIYNNEGKIIINNCKLFSNIAIKESGGSGGAIYNNKGIISLNNSEFNDNNVYYKLCATYPTFEGIIISVYSYYPSYYYIDLGIDIYNENGHINIINSRFNNNNHDKLYVYLIVNTGNLTIINGTFSNNDNCDSLILNNANLEINNSLFINNKASYGQIYNNGNLSICNSNFLNNIALYGGAIYNEGFLYIDNSTFSNNIADYGGAIYNVDNLKQSIDDYIEFQMEIYDSNFVNNFAECGGAVYNWGYVYIDNSIFLKNIAGYGGAIYNDKSFVYMNRSTFSYNNARLRGGAIYNVNDVYYSDDYIVIEMDIYGSNFANNFAECGGAIYNEGGNLNLANSTFLNNVANYGGVIYNTIYYTNYGEYICGNIFIKSSYFKSNNAVYGGVGCNNGSYLDISYSNFLNNIADFGGVFYDSFYYDEYADFYITIGLFIQNSYFNENKGIKEGACIYTSGIVSIENSTLLNNFLDNFGGVIYVSGSITFFGSILINNLKEGNMNKNSLISIDSVEYIDISDSLIFDSLYNYIYLLNNDFYELYLDNNFWANNNIDYLYDEIITFYLVGLHIDSSNIGFNSLKYYFSLFEDDWDSDNNLSEYFPQFFLKLEQDGKIIEPAFDGRKSTSWDLEIFDGSVFRIYFLDMLIYEYIFNLNDNGGTYPDDGTFGGGDGDSGSGGGNSDGGGYLNDGNEESYDEDGNSKEENSDEDESDGDNKENQNENGKSGLNNNDKNSESSEDEKSNKKDEDPLPLALGSFGSGGSKGGKKSNLFEQSVEEFETKLLNNEEIDEDMLNISIFVFIAILLIIISIIMKIESKKEKNYLCKFDSLLEHLNFSEVINVENHLKDFLSE